MDNNGSNSIDGTTTGNSIDELVRIIDTHLNPVASTSPTLTSTISGTRTYTPPLMGTSARAAKRRLDSDGGPVRIEGTDTYNQQLQHHYQNVRQIFEDQEQVQTTTMDTSSNSPQSFTAKREFVEQRFKTPPPMYDSPPQQQIVTTITTTISAVKPDVHDRTSSSSNESPSVDRVLEQAVELQKLNHINSTTTNAQPPVIIERTEQYQVILDRSNHEILRTPSVSRTSIVPITKTGHATDLDQAQAQAERLTDDHQAIQKLTRVLQEHNQSNTNEYKRLPSQTSPISSPSLPPLEVLVERTNLPVASEFSVIDALLNNPLGIIDDKPNHMLQLRYNDILSNVRNPEWIRLLKESPPSKVKPTPKKKSKEKTASSKKNAAKVPVVNTSEQVLSSTAEPIILNSSEQPPLTDPKDKKKQKKENTKKIKPKAKPKEKSVPSTTDTVVHIAEVPLVNTSEQLSSSTTEPITLNSSEQTPLTDPKDKKKQKKETKKKPKEKPKSTGAEYQAIDAIIGSPISIRLPDSYLMKYKVSPPLSQSSPLQSIPSIPANTLVTSSKDNNVPVPDTDETLFNLVKIVQELHLHHAAALTASVTIPSSKINTTIEPKASLKPTKQSPAVVNEVVHQQPLLEYQLQQTRTSHPVELQPPPPPPEPIKPRIVYRYIDEQGRVLAMSSTPPSQLRDQPSQQYSQRNVEPAFLYDRHIVVDDERRHPLPQHEQRASWQGKPKLPTTVTREDFELRDKRVPQISEQPGPTIRSIPVSFEPDQPLRATIQQPPPQQQQQQQQRVYHYPNQQNVKLAWLPLSYQAEQPYVPSGAAGYDTDSTVSERSTAYRSYDNGPADSQYRYANRPLLSNDYHSNRSPGPAYYPPPPQLPYNVRGISPEYSIGPSGQSRNYLEVFRGGDFGENKPSEVYSLPMSDHTRRSPMQLATNRHSRYDQYQSEKYGTATNRRSIPSLEPNYCYTDARYAPNIPPPQPPTVYASSYYTHRSPHHHRTVQSSPNPEYTNYIRPSKSFDYRPLRAKLQREYKITPNLLVDEWEYPSVAEKHNYSTTTSMTNRSGVSSPDDVFLSNRTSTG